MDFFIEALSNYVVQQVEPRGYVSVANTEWLIEKIEADGRVESSLELELLIRIIELAKMVPPILSAYVIRQVKQAVLYGEGVVIRHQKMLKKESIGEAEIDVLRRTLYAAGGAGHTAITQEEAEMLFDLNDTTKNAENVQIGRLSSSKQLQIISWRLTDIRFRAGRIPFSKQNGLTRAQKTLAA